MLGSVVRVVFTRIVPALVLLLAIILGWLSSQEYPLGTFIAVVYPLASGRIPPAIIGHGKMKGTPPVPDDQVVMPRPKGEMFLDLPGGYQMPQNGLGMCCRYSAYDDVLVRRTVLWYLLLGGRLIDGAHIYLNHEAIGLGIRDAIERGVPRKEIFVTTKIFSTHFGYNTTMATVPTYLDRLGLDYVDLVLIHFPTPFPFMSNDCTKRGVSKADCRAETWKALSELREKGVMRNVGVSNFGIEQLQGISNLGLAPIAVHQFQYNPWAPDHMVEIMDYCHQEGIAVTAHSSLGGSLQHMEAHSIETLQDISNKYNKTIAQIMLRWAMQAPNKAAVIPGTGNPKHMKENLDIYSFELSVEDMERIQELRSDEDAKKFFYVPAAAD